MVDLLGKTSIPVAMGIIALNGSWKIYQVNEAFADIFGRSREYFNLLDIQESGIIYKDDEDRFINELGSAAVSQKVNESEVRIVTASGDTRWMLVKTDFVTIDDEIPYLNLILIDIGEKKLLETQLELLTQQYDVMEQLTDEIPFDLDVTSWKLLHPARISQMRGEKNDRDIYVPFDDEVKNIHPVDRECFVNTMMEAMSGDKSGYIECRYNFGKVHEKPHYLWMRIYYKSIFNDKGRIVRVIGRSQNVEKNVKLREKARLDPLTKLLNKEEVQSQVEAVLEKEPNNTHVLFIIDIDNFKQINDSFGHTFGDTVISDIADTLKKQFRSDDIIGRVGGDEFLVFMKDASVEKAAVKAQNLCEVTEKEYTGGNVVKYISTSIGLAVSGVDGYTYEELFKKADHAMYRTKKSGKNGFSVARGDDTEGHADTNHENEKRAVLDDKNQDFMAFALNLLSHARNIDGSLNLMLEKMMTRYGLDVITVAEEMPDGAGFMLTNFAGDRVQFFDKTVYPKIGLKERLATAGEARVIPRESIEPWVNAARRQGIVVTDDVINNVSILAARFETFNNKTGMCCFYSLDKDKKWTNEDLDVFGELSRIIGVFVSLKTRIDESNAQLRSYQNRDILTGLLNLDSFKTKYKKIISQEFGKNILALEYFDINNFGYINENYGYQIGDKILKYLAYDIMDSDDSLLGCRLYSDFFLLLRKGEDVQKIRDEVLAGQQRFINLHNHQYPSSGLSVSTGIYFIENENIDADIAIENATLAWKHAKKVHKSQLEVFDGTLKEKRSEEQRIVGEFYEALYRGDFKMYLQPKFNLKTGAIYGAEALARWQKPDGTIIPPFKFIDSLENIGYITDLDFYIFEELLKTLTKWKKAGLRDLVVSVNFSGRHFDLDGTEFIRRLGIIMKKYPIEASQIEIEITEGVMAKNYDSLVMTLDELRTRGFRVAVDDFGTGYSSLAVLTDIPADVIKIDKSFLEKEFSEKNLNVLKSIGDLINTVGRETILEGIETVEQLKTLSECGFVYGQGYVCNKPIPVDDFENLYL